MEILLVAEVDGELVLVEQEGNALLDRTTGEVLDPAGIELRAVEVEPVAA